MPIYDKSSKAEPIWSQLEESCQGDISGETQEEEGGAAQTYIALCVVALSASAAICVTIDLFALSLNNEISFDCRFIYTGVVHRPIQIILQLNQLCKKTLHHS